MARSDQGLEPYRQKRDFRRTPEPRGTVRRTGGRSYVVQLHDARRLHYDFRLELDGVLKSWAVTKGPSLDPSDKRLAVRTEDHPIDYGAFEGVIPEGYGAGTVMLWDRGEWEPKGDPHEGLEKGALKFVLKGKRLKGGFALVRMRTKGEKRENWLLVKERDAQADEALDPREKWTRSVESGRGLGGIAANPEAATWDSAGGKREGPPPRKPGRKGRRAKLAFVPPQLATLRDAPPEGSDWLHEIKFDGYRIEALIEGGAARLFTRNGKDWTERYPAVADALGGLDAGDAVVDGELVAIDERGRSHFGTLQNVGSRRGVTLRYYAFDLLRLDGEDTRRRPLAERKDLLRSLLKGAQEPIRYSDHIAGDGGRVIAKACAMGAEGIVSKRAGAPYRSGRGTSWIKSKCVGNDEFVIVGYRKSDKRGRPFASLLLGAYSGDRLVYRGRVGTGFDERIFRTLASKMKPLVRATSPLADTPKAARAGAVWLEPKLVAQIAYTEQTADGRLRHPSFLGLREDKPAEEVAVPSRDDEAETRIGGVRVTHPDRVMYPHQGATKRTIAEYYLANAEQILPYLADRPLSLVRCPAGRDDECFFQKHHNASVPQHLATVSIPEKGGKKAPYLVIRSKEGLVAAAQIGALELHIWGARADRIERPERLVFDLDPGEDVPFSTVGEAAVELRGVLDSVGLASFVLLTGGKGVHVIAPLERRREWPDVKAFAKSLAVKVADTAPERYLAQASKARRKGRIFIDWLRNERGATAVAPYSLRARPGAPIATPVSWDELPRIGSGGQYTLDNIGKRLASSRAGPWPDYGRIRQSITDARMRSVVDGG